MRLHQLDHFVAIVEAGSIRAASRAQGLSHPAMTKSLRGLEDAVGVPLLRRSTRGVVCTPAGRALLTRARVIRAEVQKAEEELARWAQPAGAVVSVGASPVAAGLVSDAFARFLLLHPQARLRVMEGPPSVVVPLVRDATLDLAVVVRMPSTIGPGLRFKPLYDEPMVVACRASCAWRQARSLRDLAVARWLGLNAPGAGGWLEAAFAAEGLPMPANYLQCESFPFAFELMARIDAVMAVPARFVDAPPQRGVIVPVPLAPALPPAQAGLLTRLEGRLTRPAATFARAIADLARSRCP